MKFVATLDVKMQEVADVMHCLEVQEGLVSQILDNISERNNTGIKPGVLQ